MEPVTVPSTEHAVNQVLFRQSSIEIQIFPSVPEDDSGDEGHEANSFGI